MNTRRTRAKRVKYEDDYVVDYDGASECSRGDPDEDDAVRKSKIRDSNKEFAKRMTILNTWSDHWKDYTTRDGEAYPAKVAREMVKKSKKIICPIESCRKSFTTVGGLKYHYARCNIERSFKCQVCNPPLQVTTRGELLRHLIQAHYDDLPALNEEQKKIATTYRIFDNKIAFDRSTKRDKRVGNESEVPWGGNQLVKAFKDLRERVFHPDSFTKRPFRDWSLSAIDWQMMFSEFERRRYYPIETESVRFKLAREDRWKVVKTGESIILNQDKQGTPTSSIFYTGGINTAASWLPKSPLDAQSTASPDLLAVSVICCSMDQNHYYKDTHTGKGCLQFWTIGTKDGCSESDATVQRSLTSKLSYMVGHDYGIIFDMVWCPLGTSWQPQVNSGDSLSRVGLLALACGDGQIRILSVPHTSSLMAKTTNKVLGNAIESTPMFRVKPTAHLVPPGVGLSTDYQTTACKSVCWALEDNQRLIIAGYENGNVAIFDLANSSPIVYSTNDSHHVYRPLKSWVAHGAPVTSVAILTSTSDSTPKTIIATGSTDRQLKIWNPKDLNCCLSSDKAPITRILWDYRFRGIVTATDTAFTSYNNRVSYKFPVSDGSNQNVTISMHRSSVWGLGNSIITNSIATSDGAGEVFVMPNLINRSMHKRDRTVLSTHSLFSMVPQALDENEKEVPTSSVIIFTSESQELMKSNMQQSDETNSDGEVENLLEIDADFSGIERPIANKPTKFLLPLEHRSVETYADFKANFGLEFINYNFTTQPNSKLPQSCLRAASTKEIYCDRPCDYPFSSINYVSWSPNVDSLSHLVSVTQVGLCRLDDVQIIKKVYQGYVDSILKS